jgi:ribosome biogenesis GTPase
MPPPSEGESTPARPSDQPPLAALGWSDRWEALAAEHQSPTLVPARVLRHDGVAVLVGRADRVNQVHLRATTPPLAVGDWVLVDDDVVHHLLPRQSLLQRRDPTTGAQQLIAANLDVVGIVCGLDRPVRPGRIERFVTQAWDAGAVPLVVLTKADLVAATAEPEAHAAEAAPGTDVLVVSAATGEGLDRLRSRIAGRTVAFVGESGAGKSTLVNRLADREVASTGAVREGDRKGRHTTTARELHLLPDEVRLIDTPGMRAVGLWTDVDTIDDAFGDLATLAAGCRFRDCVHDTEPGCAVRAAVDAGDLAPERLARWEQYRREAMAAELRADPVARHRFERRFGRVTREAQRMKRR